MAEVTRQAAERAARGSVTIDAAECKGCGLCLEACPPKCLEFEAELNPYDVRPARYIGQGCTGCGICFYTCPEPGAITVYRAVSPPKVRTETLEPSAGTRAGESSHAPAL